MNIKEMEQRSGLPRSGIRFYESEGLLSPARSPNGYRDYSEDDLDTLMKIKRLRSLGLSLQEIKEVQSGALPLADALRAQLVRLGSMRGEMARAEAECRSLIDAGAGWADMMDVALPSARKIWTACWSGCGSSAPRTAWWSPAGPRASPFMCPSCSR